MKRHISADRVFSSIAILIVCAYGFFAFFDISAPIQYDPLGPEGWPKFLTVVALGLCLLLLCQQATGLQRTFGNSAVAVFAAAAMLTAYALVFEWLGFALATALYCSGLAGILGASRLRSIVFGVSMGASLYFVSVHLLGLNLPVGDIFSAEITLS